MTNTDELIAEKKAQIAVLKQEIKELRGPQGLAGRIKKPMLSYYPTRGIHENLSIDAWPHIRSICVNAFRYKYLPTGDGNMKISVLSEEDVNTAAEMADKIIDIWNEYIELLYADKDI